MNLYKWLSENIVLSENSSLYLCDIEKKLLHKYTNQEIGRAIQHIFPGVPVKSVRNKHYWCHFTKKYTSLGWKQSQNDLTNTQLPGTSYNNTNKENSKTFTDNEDTNMITLTESDHKDMEKILNNILNDLNIPEKMKLLISSQVQCMSKPRKMRRWDPRIIRLCLTVYCRSPRAYQDLSTSGFLVLPSKRQIQRYKNKINQEAGISKDILRWMKSEAEFKHLPAEGYEGGLLIDEMSIQEEIQLKKTGDHFEIIGFTECCDESIYIDKLIGKGELKMASHALQLLFLGHTGFRFPVGHFATIQTSPAELYLIFWKAVQLLGLFGFNVTYVSLDGAQTNRSFMKMFLPENESTSSTMKTMKFHNFFDSKKPDICIIMDFSHVMKKIRNNISKSGKSDTHKKLLTYQGQTILWEHWYKAFQWDTEKNSLKVYPKLTNDHFFLNPQLKMRNSLAEDVLNGEMLHLMLKYQCSLAENMKSSLSSSIELLKQTSTLVTNFRDSRPIHEYEDARLQCNRKVLSWFQEWENSEKCEKHLISFQTREDIVSLLIGFDEMCKDKFLRSSGSVIASRINSDPIENIFSQQRGLHNGANTNPDFLTYSRTMNTIILGQTSISRKSNTGGTGAQVYSDQRQPLKSILNNLKQK